MKYLVTVLPKDEVSDPQGEVIHDACRTLGFGEVETVRAGKSFLVEVTDGTPEARLKALADKVLINPIVERFLIEEYRG